MAEQTKNYRYSVFITDKSFVQEKNNNDDNLLFDSKQTMIDTIIPPLNQSVEFSQTDP